MAATPNDINRFLVPVLFETSSGKKIIGKTLSPIITPKTKEALFNLSTLINQTKTAKRGTRTNSLDPRSKEYRNG
jgi:hypothetical protein